MASNVSGQMIGEYQIRSIIGRGGMGIVYRAYQPRLHRYVALKVLPNNLMADPTSVDRFRREAMLSATLDHPHIVPIYDVGEERGMPYIAMRLIEGGSLQDLIERRAALPPAEVVRLLTQVAGAIDFAHQRNVIHRDIKPSNILIDANGEAILTDFGLAKFMAGSRVSGSGVIGTVGYMSPEQIENRPLTAATDIYALGLVAYEMLTGQLPYRGDSLAVILHQQVNSTPPPMRRIRHQLTAAADKVIRRVLDKKSENRYTTAGQFVASLEAALHDTAADTERLIPVVIGVSVLFLLTLCIALVVIRPALVPPVPPTPTRVALASTNTPALPTGSLVVPTATLFRSPTAPPPTALPLTSTSTVRPGPTMTLLSSLTSLPPALMPTNVPTPLIWADDFNDPKTGWDIGTTDAVERGYDNGEYFIRIKKAQIYVPVCRKWYSDATIEVDVKQMDTVAERYGIEFRGEDTQFYAFRLSDDGTFTLDRHSQENDFVPIIGPTKSAAIKLGDWNRLTVTAKGNVITLFINGQTVGSITDGTYKEGCAGLVACTCSGSQNLSVRFDNFKVSVPP